MSGLTLNHLGLVVRDVERSAAFYREAFGAVETLRDGDFLLMDVGGCDLALLKGEFVLPSGMDEFHFGFRMGSRDEVVEWHERLVSKMGLPVAEELDEDGSYASFSVSDPDGYRVQLYFEP